MAKQKVRKTRDELITAGIKMYRNMAQYRSKIASGELTDEDIFIKASDWADKQIAAREQRLEQGALKREDRRIDDDEYRATQEEAYRAQYEWAGANDEASLQQLLNLEVAIKQIQEELDDSDSADDKNKLRKSLTDITKEHRALQEKLGIDRLSRQKAEAARSTVDDWDRIKAESKKMLDRLASEFAAKAEKVTTEAELRDRMKYHFAIPFSMVDPILEAHRRVLGLDTTVQKS